MKVSFNKRFLKDLVKVPKNPREQIEEFVFNEIKNYNKSSEIIKLEKLTGYTSYYKIRFGNYRIGIKLIDEEISFERILHRKEIYKFFP